MPRSLAAAVVALTLAAAPCAAEGLTVETAAGERMPLAAITGEKAAVLHFWATWCGPCVAELPELAAFAAAHPELAERIVPVSIDRAPVAKIAAFLRDLGVGLAPLKLVEGNAGSEYKLTGYPSTVFVAADGTAVRVIAGPVPWDAPQTLSAIAAHLGTVD